MSYDPDCLHCLITPMVQRRIEQAGPSAAGCELLDAVAEIIAGAPTEAIRQSALQSAIERLERGIAECRAAIDDGSAVPVDRVQ